MSVCRISDSKESASLAVGLTGIHLQYAVSLVEAVCALAGPPAYLSELRASAQRNGLGTAVRKHDTPHLYEWLVEASSFQGVSDQAARTYIATHDRVRWQFVHATLADAPSCPLLGAYWRFHGCQYQKASGICSEPSHLNDCPLPVFDLRNGNLNQMAFSLYLFIRDLMNGDIVSWIDKELAKEKDHDDASSGYRMGQALTQPLRHVFGVSDKVLNMVLATLLLGAGRSKPRWQKTGANLIAIDRLVHNFLWRTGILARAEASHPYGARCYTAGGCADIVRSISAQIDARRYSPVFPADFPRFVQIAIWRYCAADKLDICNGNRIDDTLRCSQVGCRLQSLCDRVPLRPAEKPIK